MVVSRVVPFAVLLAVTGCSKDSSKVAGPFPDVSRLAKAFTALAAPSQPGTERCIPFFDPCETASARSAAAEAQKPLAGPRRPPTPEMAAVPMSAIKGPSQVYTVIADAEDFAPLSEFVNVLNGEGLRVLPVIGLGALSNLLDVTRNGVDLAIVPANALSYHREVEEASKKVRYVGRLYDEALHVLASRDITDLRELDGKRVNVGPPGGGAELAAQALFARLGIQPVVTNHHVESARHQLETGAIEAAIFLTARPAYEVIGFTPKTPVHLLPVPHDVMGDPAYEAAWLEAARYPGLLAGEARIPTIKVANVLAVLDGATGSERYRRLARFVRAFYGRVDELRRGDGEGPWHAFDPAADVPGWTRFRPAEEWLKQRSAHL